LDTPANRGFAAGNNTALRWAHQHTPQSWNLLLNNDTKVPEDFVEKLTNAAEEQIKTDDTPFALSATEYDFFHPRKMIHSGIQYLSIPTGLSFASSGLLRTPYLCGACILIDPKAPLMDEDYFLYYEDADYSQRLKRAGYQLLTTNQTKYFHKRGGSTSQNVNIVAIQMTSMWRYYQLYYPRWASIVKRVRKMEYILRGCKNIARIIDQTYQQAYAQE
jgi:GT2 family glycosyltransferase